MRAHKERGGELMEIPWKIIIPAMMILLTTSGCTWLFAPPPLELPVIAFSNLCQQPSTIFCQDFDVLPPESSETPEGIFHGPIPCAQLVNNPNQTCPEIDAGTLKFTVPSNSGGEVRERTIFASLTIMAGNRLGLAKRCLFSGSNAFQPVS